jgi:hypothetical protein
MTMSSHDRLGNLMLQLTDELKPFVEMQLEAVYKHDWTDYAKATWRDGALQWDISTLLGTMIDQWTSVFRHSLRLSDRDIILSLRTDRNKWAHQGLFTTDDVYDIFNNAERLLSSIRSPLAETVKKQKRALLQVIHDEEQAQLRKEQEIQEREQREQEQRQRILETLLPVYLINPQSDIVQAMLTSLQREQSLNKVTATEIADYFKRVFNVSSNRQSEERRTQRTLPAKSVLPTMPTEGSKSDTEAQGRQRVKEALEAAGYQAELSQRNVLCVQSASPTGRTVPCCIRVISAAKESFDIKAKYKDSSTFLAFVWHAQSPSQAIIYAMTYEEAFDIADRKRWTLTNSWQNEGYYSTTRPDRMLREYLKPHLMTSEKWRILLSREPK